MSQAHAQQQPPPQPSQTMANAMLLPAASSSSLEPLNSPTFGNVQQLQQQSTGSQQQQQLSQAMLAVRHGLGRVINLVKVKINRWKCKLGGRQPNINTVSPNHINGKSSFNGCRNIVQPTIYQNGTYCFWCWRNSREMRKTPWWPATNSGRKYVKFWCLCPTTPWLIRKTLFYGDHSGCSCSGHWRSQRVQNSMNFLLEFPMA